METTYITPAGNERCDDCTSLLEDCGCTCEDCGESIHECECDEED